MLLRPLVGKGLQAWGGADLASHLDLTALCLAIPYEGLIHLDLRCWIPEDAFEKRETDNGDRFRAWRSQGWLNVHPGAEINYELMLKDFVEIKKEYKIKEIAFDPWGLTMPAQTLTKAGFKIWRFRQGEKTVSPAIKDFEAAVYGKRLKHYGNPILNWAMGNVLMTKTRTGNYTPDKAKSTGKIDPVIAAVMAVSLCEQARNGKPKSAYSERARIYGRETEPRKEE